MARKYRSSRRIYVPKRKWSPHFKSFSITSGTYLLSLVDNSFSTSVPTPSIIKVKHIKVDADVQLVGEPSSTSAGILFVIYVPEGQNPNTYQLLGQYVEAHPEYIMGWTAVKYPMAGETTGGMDTVHITTRVSRNLNSGDKVCLAFLTNIQCYINGGCQFVTSTN